MKRLWTCHESTVCNRRQVDALDIQAREGMTNNIALRPLRSLVQEGQLSELLHAAIL